MLDADWAERLDMPSNSPWPIALGLLLGVMFAMLLIGQPIVAGGFAVLCGLVLVAWHSKEPAEA